MRHKYLTVGHTCECCQFNLLVHCPCLNIFVGCYMLDNGFLLFLLSPEDALVPVLGQFTFQALMIYFADADLTC